MAVCVGKRFVWGDYACQNLSTEFGSKCLLSSRARRERLIMGERRRRLFSHKKIKSKHTNKISGRVGFNLEEMGQLLLQIGMMVVVMHGTHFKNLAKWQLLKLFSASESRA